MKLQPIHVGGGIATHGVRWTDDRHGYTVCGIAFRWCPRELVTLETEQASRSVAQVDCMACIHGIEIKPPIVVFNAGALARLRLPDEDP